jgi:hypothetical protein
MRRHREANRTKRAVDVFLREMSEVIILAGRIVGSRRSSARQQKSLGARHWGASMPPVEAAIVVMSRFVSV